MLSAPLLAHALRDALATGGEAMSVSQDALMPTIAAAMALLFCSAFFSGSETALFSLQPLDRQKLNEAGTTTVDALLRTPGAPSPRCSSATSWSMSRCPP